LRYHAESRNAFHRAFRDLVKTLERDEEDPPVAAPVDDGSAVAELLEDLLLSEVAPMVGDDPTPTTPGDLATAEISAGALVSTQVLEGNSRQAMALCEAENLSPSPQWHWYLHNAQDRVNRQDARDCTSAAGEAAPDPLRDTGSITHA
jgi:hypothetical protein